MARRRVGIFLLLENGIGAVATTASIAHRHREFSRDNGRTGADASRIAFTPDPNSPIKTPDQIGKARFCTTFLITKVDVSRCTLGKVDKL